MTTSLQTKLKPQKTLEQHQKEYQDKHVNIVITRKNYDDMRLLGQVPESMNDILSRLLQEKKQLIEAIRAAKKSK
jgi:hypothetical protein